jgi:hypothetical protein
MVHSQRTYCPAGRLVSLFELVLAIVMALIVGTTAGCRPKAANAAMLQLATTNYAATDRASSSVSSSESVRVRRWRSRLNGMPIISCRTARKSR